MFYNYKTLIESSDIDYNEGKKLNLNKNWFEFYSKVAIKYRFLQKTSSLRKSQKPLLPNFTLTTMSWCNLFHITVHLIKLWWCHLQLTTQILNSMVKYFNDLVHLIHFCCNELLFIIHFAVPDICMLWIFFS